MTTAEKLMTVEEFACLPEPLEGGKMELVDGRVVKMPPASGGHGRRALDLGSMLREFVKKHDLGEMGVEIGFVIARDPHLVLAPDIAFVAEPKASEVDWDAGFIEAPPTLAVEIVSPNDRAAEVQNKVNIYLTYGAARVWVVEPKTKTVVVHRPGGDSHTYHIGESLSSDDAAFAVDGFRLPLDELFV
jgi:Uma2 family endonuclease